MATPPKPPVADSKILQEYAVKLGFAVNKDATKQVEDQFKGLANVAKQFKASASFKDSMFDGNVLTSLKKALPTSEFFNFQKTMLGLGTASKQGAIDGGAFFKSLSMSGKLGVNTVDLLGAAFTKMGFSAVAAMTMATLGVAALVAAVLALVAAMGKVAMSVVDSRDELVQFDKIALGLGKEGLVNLQGGINRVDMSAMKMGMNLTEVNAILADFAKSGVSLSRITGEFQNLAVTTKALSTITGESDANVASLFSGLIVKAHFSNSSLEKLSNSFVSFNKIATKVGLANVSFGAMKEAIDSSTNAIMIASSRGSQFAEKMSKDLISLAGLATNLGISVGEMNNKFEEAGNLLTSESSGFRNILAISGGANFGQMLSGQFDKTDAMLKVADKLQQINKKFGGQLNITAQIAEKTFGVSKETAIKLITMTAEQQRMIRETQEAVSKVETDSLKEAYGQVTNTLGDIWTKFKNSIMGIFKIGISQNQGFLGVLERIANKLAGWYEQLGAKGGPFETMANKIGEYATKIAKWAEGLLDKAPALFEKLGDWFGKIVDYFKGLYQWMYGDGMGVAIIKGQFLLIKIATDMGEAIGRGLLKFWRENNGVKGLVFGLGMDAADNKEAHTRLLPEFTKNMMNAYENNLKKVEQTGDKAAFDASFKATLAFIAEKQEKYNKIGLGDKFNDLKRVIMAEHPILSRMLGAMNSVSSSTNTMSDSTKEQVKILQESLNKDKARLSELKQIGDTAFVYDIKNEKRDENGNLVEGQSYDLMLAGEKRVELEKITKEEEDRLKQLNALGDIKKEQQETNRLLRKEGSSKPAASSAPPQGKSPAGYRYAGEATVEVNG